jgi:hypothetical protein
LKSYEGLMFEGLFCKFLEKIRNLDFLELFLDGKIRGLSPRGCGLPWPGPPWTGGHCCVPELIEARPPAALVAGVAGRGAGELRGARGYRFRAHRGSEGGGAVKAAVGRALVRVTWGMEMGQGGAGEERWEEGMQP